jgi:DNA-binding SARP family transcriptional activator
METSRRRPRGQRSDAGHYMPWTADRHVVGVDRIQTAEMQRHTSLPALTATTSPDRDGLVHIQLLDTFEVSFDGRCINLPAGARRLVALLALARTTAVRDHVAYQLWPDGSEARAQANLRSALWRVRQAGLGLIESNAGRLRIGHNVSVDVHVLSELAEAVIGGRMSASPADVKSAMTAGDLLSDWYDPWLSDPRERLRQLRLHGLEALCSHELERGNIGAAIDAGLAAVAAEPLRESAHRSLIRAHLAEANAAEALRQYERFRSLLFTELGILPSPHLEELVDPIRVNGSRKPR